MMNNFFIKFFILIFILIFILTFFKSEIIIKNNKNYNKKNLKNKNYKNTKLNKMNLCLEYLKNNCSKFLKKCTKEKTTILDIIKCSYNYCFTPSKYLNQHSSNPIFYVCFDLFKKK